MERLERKAAPAVTLVVHITRDFVVQHETESNFVKHVLSSLTATRNYLLYLLNDIPHLAYDLRPTIKLPAYGKY